MCDEYASEVPISGYRKVVEVYGYWISFHDASVETVMIDRRGPTVTIAFETCDMAYHDGDLVDNDRQARVVVRWQGVRDLRLEGIGTDGRNWIDGLTLKRLGEDILAELELMDGFHGMIVAQRVEILEVDPI